MGTDEKLESDLHALARATTRGLPSLDDTARALAEARAHAQGASTMSKMRKPLLASALTVAAATAILIFPVPYSRHRGFDVTFTGSDGRVAHLHLPGHDRAKAELRARALAHGATVTIEPRRERVWGSVYAMAQEKLFHLDVDMQGKSDAQVEDEIKAQIAGQGWDPDSVDVKRSDNGSSVSITAHNGDNQRHVELRSSGGSLAPGDRLQLEDLDVERTPGMTDAELKQKLLEELKARGLEGDVTVENGQVRVHAQKKRVEN